MATPKRNPRLEEAFTSGAAAILERIATLPSLDELFARDPASHTYEDRSVLAQHMREQRALWKLKEDRKAGSKEEKETAE